MSQDPSTSVTLSMAQRWILSIMVLFPERHQDGQPFESAIARPHGSFEAWGALKADGLLTTQDVKQELVWLMTAAKTSDPIYHLVRAAVVASRAHTAFLLSLDEAWEVAKNSAIQLQNYCSGWFSMAEACLAGLHVYEGPLVAKKARQFFYQLHQEKESPWNVLPWRLPIPESLPAPSWPSETKLIKNADALREALLIARPNTTLALLAGRYEGSFELNVPGLRLKGGLDVVFTSQAPETSVFRVTAPTVMRDILVRVPEGGTGILNESSFLRLERLSIRGGANSIALQSGFVQMSECRLENAKTAILSAGKGTMLEETAMLGCVTGIKWVKNLELAHLSNVQVLGAKTALSFSEDGAESPATLCFQQLHVEDGKVEVFGKGELKLSDSVLMKGIAFRGGTLEAKNSKFSGLSTVSYGKASFKDCHFVNGEHANLILGEGQECSIVGGQLAKVNSPDGANLWVYDGELTLRDLAIGPSQGKHIAILPEGDLSRSERATAPRTLHIQVDNVVCSSSGRESLYLQGEGHQVRLELRRFRIRTAAHAGMVLRNALVIARKLDMTDLGGAGIYATKSHLEILGFGLRHARLGWHLENSTFIAKHVVATDLAGGLFELKKARMSLVDSDVMLLGRVEDGMLSVTGGMVPQDGLFLKHSSATLRLCHLLRHGVNLESSVLHLQHCELVSDAVVESGATELSIDEDRPFSSTTSTPAYYPMESELFLEWGLSSKPETFLKVADRLAVRLHLVGSLALREGQGGIRIDGPLSDVVRFIRALDSLLKTPSSLGVVLGELLGESD